MQVLWQSSEKLNFYIKSANKIFRPHEKMCIEFTARFGTLNMFCEVFFFFFLSLQIFITSFTVELCHLAHTCFKRFINLADQKFQDLTADIRLIWFQWKSKSSI